MRRPGVYAILMCILTLFHSPCSAQRADKFIGDLVLKDSVDVAGRQFELVAPFGYIDPNGTRWQAEAGLVTDGASIPQALWSIIGGPYEGLHRRASIIHDYYCDRKYRSWERTHRAFYDALVTAGVSEPKAKLMYYAVWRFGPRWEVSAIVDCLANPAVGRYCANSQTLGIKIWSSRPKIHNDKENAIRAEVESISKRLSLNNIQLGEIENLADRAPSLETTETTRHISAKKLSGVLSEIYQDYKITEE